MLLGVIKYENGIRMQQRAELHGSINDTMVIELSPEAGLYTKIVHLDANDVMIGFRNAFDDIRYATSSADRNARRRT